MWRLAFIFCFGTGFEVLIADDASNCILFRRILGVFGGMAVESTKEQHYSYSDLLSVFSERVLRYGADYVSKGQVSHVRSSAHGSIVTGRVSVNTQLFRVLIEVSRQGNGDLKVVGECPCSVGKNCKHAAGVLLQQLYEQGDFVQEIVSEERFSEVDEWWDELDAIEDEDEQDSVVTATESCTQQLVYLLGYKIHAGEAEFRCHVKVFDSEADQPSDVLKQFKPGSALYNGYAPAYVGPEDLEIFPLLEKIAERFSQGGLVDRLKSHVPKADLFNAVQRLVSTGRAFWVGQLAREVDIDELAFDKPLKWIKRPQSGRVDWLIDAGGNQQFGCVVERDGCEVFNTNPPIYIDTRLKRVGEINTGLDVKTLAALWALPVLKPEHVKGVVRQYRKLFCLPGMALPRVMTKRRIHSKPYGKLRLLTTDVSYHRRGFRNNLLDLAVVSFGYDSVFCGLPHSKKPLISFENGELCEIHRDISLEKALVAELDGLRPIDSATVNVGRGSLTGAEMQLPAPQWKEFLTEKVPELKKAGWVVEIDESFRHKFARAEQWKVSLNEKVGWFELSIGVLIEGQWYDLLPCLVKYIKNAPRNWQTEILPTLPDNDSIFVEMEHGIKLAVSVGRVRHILTTLVELCDEQTAFDKNGMQVPLSQVGRVSELIDHQTPSHEADIEMSLNDRLEELANDLLNFEERQNVKLPKTFKGELRGYQQEGVNWLQWLREHNLGGVLADDMGLGKTIQTIAHLAIEKAEGYGDKPSLIVAPTSVLGNWRRELEKFFPKAQVLTFHGGGRKETLDTLPAYDVVLTTYALLARDEEQLAAFEFNLILLDEAQLIKNSRAKVSRAVRKLEAQQKICLTGTPLENHLGDLWSLFDFLMPGFLGAEKSFRKYYSKPIERGENEVRLMALARRIAPFMLRRTKEEVASELPSKSEITCLIDIVGDQRDLYETVRVSQNRQIQQEILKQGFAQSRMTILNGLLKLRQACCDPRLVDLEAAVDVQESAKLDYMLNMLSELIHEGRRVLVFSQFTSMLEIIARELDESEMPYTTLTGQTRNREEVIQEFQNGGAPIFLISLKAGGTGLNLTSADTVIHYDPWWNPAVERQATDRIYRIGQDKPVFVYKLIAKDTVEEKIASLQKNKQKLFEGVVESQIGSLQSFLSQGDIESLFGSSSQYS